MTTKQKFVVLWILWVLIIPVLWCIFLDKYVPILGDIQVVKTDILGQIVGSDYTYGNLHYFVNIIIWLPYFVFTLWGGFDLFTKNDNLLYNFFEEYFDKKEDEEELPQEKTSKWTFGRYFKFGLLFIIICLFISFSMRHFSAGAKMYNTSKLYHNNYIQLVQYKQGFYDNMWKTFVQKNSIVKLNRETFIEVAKIIMEARKDGQNLSWKWVQENQDIPFGEFTKFYADLSTFIESQRQGYLEIEGKCQFIANQNNTLLDTFPNNIYNKFVNCKPIEFEYGFLSDSTENIFKTKKENIK